MIMRVLTWCVANWRIILSVALVAGSFVTGWANGSGHTQRQWDIDVHIRTKAVLEQVQANDRLKTALEETKNVNSKTIDMLAATITKLRADNRLHLYPTPCTGGLPSADTSSGSKDAPTGNGFVSEPVQSGAEEALNSFDGAYAAEALRADKIVEDCRVLRDWAMSLPSP